MFLYLVRHADAKESILEPERNLSDAGLAQAASMAEKLARVPIDIVYHSGKARARTTAAIIAEPHGITPEESGCLSPSDEPRVWADRLAGGTDNVMLVGHLPFMDRLASLLLAGDPDAHISEFAPASAMCLKYAEGRWRLQWFLRP